MDVHLCWVGEGDPEVFNSYCLEHSRLIYNCLLYWFMHVHRLTEYITYSQLRKSCFPEEPGTVSQFVLRRKADFQPIPVQNYTLQLIPYLWILMKKKKRETVLKLFNIFLIHYIQHITSHLSSHPMYMDQPTHVHGSTEESLSSISHTNVFGARCSFWAQLSYKENIKKLSFIFLFFFIYLSCVLLCTWFFIKKFAKILDCWMLFIFTYSPYFLSFSLLLTFLTYSFL